jgi:hypothetical protein
MENSELNPTPVTAAETPAPLPFAPAANTPRWWRRSVWWAASAVILTLGIVNGPTAWAVAARDEGIYLSLAFCGTGLVLAQLFMVALVLGCTEESWLRRVTRAYPVFLAICATVAGGWYLGALWENTKDEMNIRRAIGGTLLLMIEAQAIAVFVVALMRGQYQARFVHQGIEPLPETPLRWSLRDMLLWTAYIAATLAIVRLMPWYLDENDPEDLFFSGFCTFIAGFMLAFLTTGAAMEFFAHYPPHKSVWKWKYNVFLFLFMAAMVMIDASGVLFEYETVLFRILIAFMAYCNGIAAIFAALEGCGWRLMISTSPRRSAVEGALSRSNKR